jgi:hypothetical protein
MSPRSKPIIFISDLIYWEESGLAPGGARPRGGQRIMRAVEFSVTDFRLTISPPLG